MPEVRLGVPSVVEAALLPQLIGWGRTRQWLLTGDTIDAATAHAWGLVEEVVPAGTARCGGGAAARTRSWRRVRARSGLQKALITAWEDLPLREAMQRGIDSFAAAWETDEPHRMMQDFLDRRRERKLAAGRTEKPA